MRFETEPGPSVVMTARGQRYYRIYRGSISAPTVAARIQRSRSVDTPGNPQLRVTHIPVARIREKDTVGDGYGRTHASVIVGAPRRVTCAPGGTCSVTQDGTDLVNGLLQGVDSVVASNVLFQEARRPCGPGGNAAPACGAACAWASEASVEARCSSFQTGVLT